MKVNETMKKLLSYLLVLSMVLAYAPMPALADTVGCTVADCTGTYVDGTCDVCGGSQMPDAPEETSDAPCSHTGGTATCTAQAVCDICGKGYGELAGHDYADGKCSVCGADQPHTHSYTEGVCGCGEVCTHTYAEGVCTVCSMTQPCSHTGGSATCTAQAVCDNCGKGYGELAGHDYADGKCSVCGADQPHTHSYTDGVCSCGEVCTHTYAEGVCTVCSMTQPCSHTGGTATCTAQAVCDFCGKGYGELAGHVYGKDGKCACGAKCEHNYAEDICTVCGMAAPKAEPVCGCTVKCVENASETCDVCKSDLTKCIGAEPETETPVVTVSDWEWVDQMEIYNTKRDVAELPSSGPWEDVLTVLPAFIRLADGTEVTVTWTCENFAAVSGIYTLTATLPEGYVLEDGTNTLSLTLEMAVDSAEYTGSEPHKHCVYGCNSDSSCGHEQPEWTEWTGAPVDGVVTFNSGYYYLTDEFPWDCKNWTANGNVHICVNGNTGGTDISYHNLKGPFTLTSCKDVTLNGSVCVEGSSTLNLYKVSIAGNSQMNGAIVVDSSGATLNMHSGTATSGYVSDGHFHMKGGTITGTVNASWSGKFTMSGGEVKENVELKSIKNGQFTFNMEGGQVTGNVEVKNNGTLNISGGSITNLSLPEGFIFHVTRSLTDSKKIGITVPTENAPVKIGINGPDISGTDTSGYFYSNVDGYVIDFDNGELYLRAAKPVESVTLNKDTLSMTVGQTPEQLTATVEPDDVAVTWYSSAPAVATVDSTGKVTALAEGTADITAAVDGKSATCTVTVVKATITPTVSITGWTYGETANQPSVTGNTGNASVTYCYKVKDASDDTYSETVPTNAGTYTVKAEIAATGTYSSGTATADFTIAKKTVTPRISGNVTKAYDGNTNVPAEHGLSIALDNLVNGNAVTVSASYVFNSANVGTRTVTASDITLSGEDSGNYELSATTASAQVGLITKKQLDVSNIQWNIPNNLVYNGQEQTVSLSGTLPEGVEVAVSSNKATNAGEYTATAVFSLEESFSSDLYEIVNGADRIASWQIAKKNISTATVTLGDALTYNGQPQTKNVVSVIADGLEVTFDVTNNTQTNAGTYSLTVTGNGNFEGTVTPKWSIAKAYYDMTGVRWNYTAPFAYDGSEKTVSVTGLPSDVTATYTGNKATATGEYTAKATLAYDANNYIEPTVDDLVWRIENNWTPMEDKEFTTSAESDDWVREFVVTPADGYFISETNTAGGSWMDKLTKKDDTGKGTVTFYLKDNKTGAISLAKELTYMLDNTPPKGKVAFVERTKLQKAINTITFNLFYKNQVEVQVTAEDKHSGVDKVEYFASNRAMTPEEVKTITGWKAYPEGGVSVALEDAKRFVYFVRITDKAGNVTYLSTDGAEYDTTAPVISGVESGKTYYTTQTATVTDKNLYTVMKTVTLGTETLNDEAAASPITLEGDKTATYTIVAKDKAGNETTVTVQMKTIASLSEPIDDLTAGNVTSADRTAIQNVLNAVEDVLEDAEITEEANKLEAIQTRAEELLTAIDAAAGAIDTEDIQKVKDKDETNVKLEDIEDLKEAKKALEAALTDANKGNYTAAEQAAIQADIERLEKAIAAIEETEAVIDAIDLLPDTVEPDLKEEDEKKIRDVKAAFDKLTDHQKSLMQKDDKDKLERLFKTLTDYEIVSGSGSRWVKDSSKSLTFTANGPARKFKELRVDDKVVASTNYTYKEGSTIVTLYSKYLQSLSTGKHTIQVVFTDGATEEGTFRIYSNSGNPLTADNSQIMLLGGVMVTSLLCMVMMVMFLPHKKGKFER